MILKSETPIGENETSAELFDRLTEIGADLLLTTLEQIEGGTAPRIPQDDSQSCYACLLYTSELIKGVLS